MRNSSLTIAALVVVIVACGAPSPATRAPTRGATTGSWETTSWIDRHQTMTFAVLPNMARTWQRFERTQDAELTCRRCHGANAEEVDYKMPNGLPPLDPARMPSPQSSDPREARMAKFMIDEVVPEMIDLLDARPYDAKSGTGFGCFSCHPTVKR